MRPISLHNLIRRAELLACATLAPALLSAQQQVDVLIRGGSVIDGTGSAARAADVGIRGDRITFVGNAATSRVTTSGYVRVQSGTPWAARAKDIPGAVLNVLEPSGSHRNPTWTNLDLMAAYRLPLSVRANISLEARVLNVFNNQTQLSTDAQKFLDLRTQTTAPFIQPYQQPNPFFGTGNSFAPPRRLYLATVVNF